VSVLRIFNVAKIGVLLLCILLTLPMLTGCANEEKKGSPEKQSVMEDEWRALIGSEQSCVSKIEIGAYVAQPVLSSTAVIVQDIEVNDANYIHMLLGILERRDVNFYDHNDYIEDFSAYRNSKAGMEMIQITLFDSENQGMIRVNVYADNSGDIFKLALNPGGKEVWRFAYVAEFEQPIFDSVQSYYNLVNGIEKGDKNA
jgi:hypothetical protein